MNGIGPRLPASGGPPKTTPFVEYMRQAMRATGWNCEALAAHWKINRSHVQRSVTDDKPFFFYRIHTMPLDLQRALCTTWANDLGLVVGELAAIARMTETVLELEAITLKADQREQLAPNSNDAVRLVLYRAAERLRELAHEHESEAERLARAS